MEKQHFENSESPRTFHHLTGMRFTFATCTSDGKPVEGTEREKVALFNTDVISADEVMELAKQGTLEFSDKVVLVPLFMAMSIADKRE